MSPHAHTAGAGLGATRSGGGPSAGHPCARSTRSGTRACAGRASARSTGSDAAARGARFGRRRRGRCRRRTGRRRHRRGDRRGRRVFAVVAGAACRGQRAQGDSRGDAGGDGNAARNSNIGHVSSQSLRVGPTFSVNLPSACRFQAWIPNECFHPRHHAAIGVSLARPYPRLGGPVSPGPHAARRSSFSRPRALAAGCCRIVGPRGASFERLRMLVVRVTRIMCRETRGRARSGHRYLRRCSTELRRNARIAGAFPARASAP